jgi:hypothetical protein
VKNGSVAFFLTNGFPSELPAADYQPDERSVFFVYLPSVGWGVGTTPNILVNWYGAESGDMLTFPIGLNISKVIKIGPLPFKFIVQPQYMPFHPDRFGRKWNLQFAIIPVIHKMVRRNIFGG